jgi:hypothetical protein
VIDQVGNCNGNGNGHGAPLVPAAVED